MRAVCRGPDRGGQLVRHAGRLLEKVDGSSMGCQRQWWCWALLGGTWGGWVLGRVRGCSVSLSLSHLTLAVLCPRPRAAHGPLGLCLAWPLRLLAHGGQVSSVGDPSPSGEGASPAGATTGPRAFGGDLRAARPGASSGPETCPPVSWSRGKRGARPTKLPGAQPELGLA